MTLALDESEVHATGVRVREDGGSVVRVTDAEDASRVLSVARVGTGLTVREHPAR
jgi:hypothetical protein